MDLYIDFPKTKKNVTMWQHEEEFREVETYGEVNRFHTCRSQIQVKLAIAAAVTM